MWGPAYPASDSKPSEREEDEAGWLTSTGSWHEIGWWQRESISGSMSEGIECAQKSDHK